MKKKNIVKFANSYHGRQFNNKIKAFTLIELLAIIVILAIIAVITIPTILNVIDNAKKGAAIDSAYGYKDAVYKGFLEELSNDSSFEFPSGVFLVNSESSINGGTPTRNIEVNVSGTIPDITSNSWLELRKGEVVAYSLKIGDYIVTKYENEKVTATKGTEVALNTEAKKIEDAKNAALTRVNELLNGNTDDNKIIEFAIEGSEQKEWIAKLEGEIIGYSVKVESNGINYIVTKNGDTVSVEEIVDDFTIGDKTTSENQIIDYYKGIATTKINNIIDSISSDSVKSTILTSAQTASNDVSIKVSEISGVTNPTEMNSNSWVYYTYISSPASVSVNDYSIAVTEGGYTFVKNMTGGTSTEVVRGNLSSQKSVPVISWILNDGTRDVTYYAASWVRYKGIVKFDPTAGTNGEACTTGDTCYTWYKFGEYAESGKKYIKMVMGSNLVTTNWTNRNTALENAITVDGEVTWKVTPTIITAQEVANITGAARSTEDGGIGWNTSTATLSNGFVFNSDYSKVGKDTVNNVNKDYSPWLYNSGKSLLTDTVTMLDSLNWYVCSSGYMDYGSISTTFELRPVITITES